MNFSSSTSAPILPWAKSIRINKYARVSSYRKPYGRLRFDRLWKSRISTDLSRFDLYRRSSSSSIVSDSILHQLLISNDKDNDDDDDDDDDLFSDFNNATYCFAYCSIIIIGVFFGGWIGGLFEFFVTNHHGCDEKHNGTFHCRLKYETTNVQTICVNIFFNHIDSFPYLCLCRYQNQVNSRFRHCDFLNATIF